MSMNPAKVALGLIAARLTLCAAELPPPFPADPNQILERTCFQTSKAWSPNGNLRSDVAIVYGIDAQLPERIQTWRDRGYRIHVMTGVAWGQYQDYLYGRFDGVNHEDEAQTEASGKKISHGGDVYYMSPGTNYGRFLSVGVQRALDAGAEAIHLEEPEFWIRAGYSEGFKREWKAYYGEDWQTPHESVDAAWRSAKLKYFLYRRALQQVFDHVQAYNAKTGRKVRCYVPTHSLINYAQWGIVSPESSLARLQGCDGYIAQVWTGTSRSENIYRGKIRERTFETAFLEYGAMQNLVRATGRTVWYLNDPVEDNPRHDWDDYKTNWESTLVASLLQPEVSRYEVSPWPERVFGGRYPQNAKPEDRKTIPPEYATELQTVMNALNDMDQPKIEWDSGTRGLGVLVSDSLMFERGQPTPSEPYLSGFYGLAMPLVKRGLPVTPVQLENATLPDALKAYRVLLLSYHGQKPLSADVHNALAKWVKAGGSLVFVDNDADPYNTVREWWNSDGLHFKTPREDLFAKLGLDSKAAFSESKKVGKGAVLWMHENPADLAKSKDGDVRLMAVVRKAADKAGLKWKETNHLLLRRGPYVVAAGLDESVDGPAKEIKGRFVSLFDPALKVRKQFTLEPKSRAFLLDLDEVQGPTPRVLASACKALPAKAPKGRLDLTVEGVGSTPAVVLVKSTKAPKAVTLEGETVSDVEFSKEDDLVWVRFQNESRPRNLVLQF
jgi:hypothetical protein